MTEDDSSEIVQDRRPFGFLSFFCFHDSHHAGLTENPGCFQSRPEKRLYIWPPLRKTCFRPEKRAYLWPAPAQSRRIKPLGSACAACFEEQADVFASCGALHYAKILASLKMKFILPSHLVRLSFKTRICCARCKSTACRSG